MNRTTDRVGPILGGLAIALYIGGLAMSIALATRAVMGQRAADQPRTDREDPEQHPHRDSGW